MLWRTARSGYGIVSASAPGVAAKEATNGKVQPLDRTVLTYCLQGISRTSGSEPARRRFQWRNEPLIEPYR